MFKAIFKKELQISITSYSLFSGFALCLFLCIASAYIRAGNYGERHESYIRALRGSEDTLKKVKVYSMISGAIWVIRKPRPMSIFVAGLDEKVGNSMNVSHGESSGYIFQSLYSMDNPYLRIFSQIDLGMIFQIILSLFALLFSYRMISGDKEDGCLKLILANGIPRWKVIMAKYTANAVILFLLTLVGIAAGITGMISGLKYLPFWKAMDLGRGAIFILITSLYALLFLAIGVLISTITHRASTSLIIAIFIWVVLIVAYPKLSSYLVENICPVEPELATFERLSKVWQDYEKEVRGFVERIGIGDREDLLGPIKAKGKIRGGGGSSSLWGRSEWVWIEGISGEIDPRIMKCIEFRERLAASYADKASWIWMEYLKRGPIRQARIALNVMRLSPAIAYYNSLAIISGTDLESTYIWFLDEVGNYRKELMRYLEDKEAFRSPKWFTTDSGSVDLSDMPRFRDTLEPISSALSRAIVDILILLVLNFVFLIGSYAAFSRYDVR